MIGWGIGVVGLVAAGAITLAVVGIDGSASAQTGEEEKPTRGERYRELLAQELGISVDALVQAQMAARDKLIEEALAADDITAERAERLKSLEPGEGMRFAFGRHALGQRMHSAIVSVFEIAADVVGLEVRELRERMAGGESLADIASAQNIDGATLKSDLVAALTEAVNQAVADGDLDQAKADMLLERIDEMVERAINAELPMPGRFDGPMERFRERMRS